MVFRDLVPWTKRRRQKTDLAHKEETPDIFRDMLEDFFGDWGGSPWSSEESVVSPALDISETEDAYKVTAELPGMSKDDVELNIDHGVLTLSGKKREEEKTEEENFLRVERTYGSFSRSVPLPSSVNEEAVEASFSEGVLTIKLPKNEEARGKKIEIKSE
ncbi:MAG: Hsp20/alpha crystallin family protein [Candidatus Brocadiia bacterium]